MTFLLNNISLDGKIYPLVDRRFGIKNNFTIILGKNGSGKSRLLKKISSSFSISDQLLREQPFRWEEIKNNHTKIEEYNFEYQVNNQKIEVYSLYKDLASSFVFNDGIDYTLNYRDYFPKSLICVSTSPFDRFPEQRKYPLNREDSGEHCEFPSIYHYIGLKQGGKCSSINSLLKSVVNSVLSSSNQGEFKSKIISVFKTIYFLGYGNRIKLSFKFDNNISKSLDEKNKINYSIFYKLFDETKEKYIYDIEQVINQQYFSKNNKYNEKFTLSITEDSNSSYLSHISKLINNEFITITDFKLSDKNDNRRFIKFSDASSGEQCVTLMLMGIAGCIKNDSLILIDEPEISLHPEWQNKFVPLLNDICNDYSGCHFIIATHSPQIVTSLRMTNAAVLNLDTNKIINTTNFDNQSIDYQLVTSFDSFGIGNEYLNRLCVKTLSLISKGVFDSEVHKNIEFFKSSINKIKNDEKLMILVNIIFEAKEVYEKTK